MNKHIYPVLLLMLVIAAFFHVQSIVLAIAGVIIALSFKGAMLVLKMVRLFALLLLPVLFGFVVGLKNDSYLILKDAYYFTMPVYLILSGIVLASSMDIETFLKTLVIGGVVASVIVTGISVSYMGFGAFTDPYSAHYAMGILGTPVPSVALGCLLLTKKFNIRLFTPFWFRVYLLANIFGIYMFASRSYFIVTACFVFLLVADKIKRAWIIAVVVILVMVYALLPTDLFKETSSATLMGKIMGSFSEISIGDYNTEQDINLRYRGYESFMALNGYMEGSASEMIFGGLGKLVDLKTFVRLGEDTDFRYIPVLHNGWIYLLIKTGIMGVATYLLVFFGLMVSNWKRYADPEGKPIIKLFAALSIGCILSLLLTNYIVTSFFNVEMSVIMIALGYSYVNFYSLLARLKERENLEPAEAIPMNDLIYSI